MPLSWKGTEKVQGTMLSDGKKKLPAVKHGNLL